MIRFKFNVYDALQRIGFTPYQARKTGILSQDTLKKLKNEDAALSLETINRLCILLEMDINSIIYFVPDDQEKKDLLKENEYKLK